MYSARLFATCTIRRLGDMHTGMYAERFVVVAALSCDAGAVYAMCAWRLLQHVYYWWFVWPAVLQVQFLQAHSSFAHSLEVLFMVLCLNVGWICFHAGPACAVQHQSVCMM
jgi:hypothetical protein